MNSEDTEQKIETRSEIPKQTYIPGTIETIDKAIQTMAIIKNDVDKEMQYFDQCHRRLSLLVINYNRLNTQLEKIIHLQKQNV